MKITSIKFYHAQLKLRKPFITSLGFRDHANNIFVEINTNVGLTGWGECSPYPLINGETVDTCFVVGKMLAQRLIGEDPRETAELSALMDKTIYANTSIKSAIDIACHDLAAKSCDEPLYLHLGGKINKKIYTDYTVSINTIEQMVKDAIEVKERGFPVIKVKLGDGGPQDVKRIEAIREAVGSDIGIRIDANQGWKVKEAISTLQAINGANIQYCEEPINKHNYFKLKKVRKSSPIKIMADECLHDHYDARKLIKGDHADYFNIKLGKSSGLVKAQKIIQEAEVANIAMQIGGFLESRILFTANCHLAHTSDLVKYYDFDSALFHETDPVIGGMEYQHDWEIRIPESPGLGLEVDRKFLDKCKSLEIN
ncbi:mandelate racemase/muconate lactonizing enzyme family protein [Roseivirga pacifica]|uniref:mandelate racemase/muconate lactonizing enzyme family protein n=1 Tax=Roseivirga pacifica TaxID=1267423 RepID=UPI0020965878|nr:dipeptide epimerase [Roseivirga pacifica]MCO6357940.1 dipeptide epimerase [Roseivirga pacifica]MCO6366379.1 dipeptide epimerase [Roseivirga pacifica]MCO6370864.1 dipeptide epimerase [Roseivirga pacifica]MCO6373672.1 dipeptide epimerase [Roseivirga pacifica]MCO6380653.1 dipeptide epimerase [Roseivirga pacifica]